MKAELMNEFYLLQQSLAPYDYREKIEEQVYEPLKKANHKMTSWIYRRGKMLMTLDRKMNSSMKHLRRKYLKF